MSILTARQRIFSAKSEEPVGVELLARWRLASGAIVRPADAPQQDWGAVDLEIISQAAERHLAGDVDGGLLFLNISESLLSNPKRLFVWLGHIRTIQHCGGKCVVEITEQVFDKTLRRQWAKLKQHRLLLALDDFGSDFSTMERLTAFEWDFCKIDARLIGTDSTTQAIEYCRSAGIKLVAECIEDEDLRKLATCSGAVLHQGYLWESPCIKTATGEGEEALAC